MLKYKNMRKRSILLVFLGIFLVPVTGYAQNSHLFLLSAKRGHLKQVKQQLADGVPVNIPNSESGSTALILAAHRKHTEVVEVLLAHPEIDINAANRYGYTALHAAIDNHGSGEEIIKKLLAREVIEVNAQNNDGQTALMLSCAAQEGKQAQLLLEHPATDVNMQDSAGNSALMYAAYKINENEERISYSLGRYYQNPFALLRGYGNLDALNALLARPEININFQNSDGFTALMLAAYSDNIKAVELLMSRKDVNIYLTNKDGKTALDLAREKKYRVVQRLILNAGMTEEEALAQEQQSRQNIQKQSRKS